MNRVIEYVISARDATAGAVRSATARVRSFAASAVSNLANVKAGLDMLLGAARSFAGLFASAVGEAFRFEKARADFKVLLGSADEAKAHIADLRRFASETPLTFGDLSKASKLLLSFGSDAQSVMPTLKTLSDISMGDAQKFQGLALVFAQVKSMGKLMGQDLLQMVNQGFNPLSAIAKETGASMSELKDLMAEGAISFEMVEAAMRSATAEGGLFHDALKETSTTGEGLVSTLRDKWTDAVRAFGEAFSDAAKGGLQSLIDKITELVESGRVDEWANAAGRALAGVAEAASWVAKAVGVASRAFGAVRDWGERTGAAVGAWVGTRFNGGTAKEAWAAGTEARRQAEREQEDRRAEDAAAGSAARARRRAAREAAAAQSAGTAVDAGTSGGRSLAQMLDEASAAKRQKEAEAKAEAAKKAAEAEERERRRVEAEIAKERQRLQRQLVREYEAGVTAADAKAADARDRLAAAEARERQAWGWYRDKDSLRAQIEEEKADAAAERQFEKDFERLRFRRDWRTATDLSLDDEAVRRVGVAREEEAAAREYAKQTAEAAARAAEAAEAARNALERIAADIQEEG